MINNTVKESHLSLKIKFPDSKRLWQSMYWIATSTKQVAGCAGAYISPWHNWKIAHFGVKQQSRTQILIDIRRKVGEIWHLKHSLLCQGEIYAMMMMMSALH
jgi:hypothetical protein